MTVFEVWPCAEGEISRHYLDKNKTINYSPSGCQLSLHLTSSYFSEQANFAWLFYGGKSFSKHAKDPEISF